MTLQESISDFAELYLSIDLPRKDIDLIKGKSISRKKNMDELEQTVSSFRNLIKTSRNHFQKVRTKSHYALPDPWERLLHISPEEFLLLTGEIRYGLSRDVLSLILSLPVDTLFFRISTIHQTFQLNEHEIKNLHLHLKPLEKKRFTQIQSLKSKFRLQSFLVESLVTMASILFIIWSIPTLKNRYDRWIEKKTNEYFVETSMKDAPIPEELNHPPKTFENEIKEAYSEEPQKPVAAERRQPKVFSDEVWRFSFNGSSKNDLESEILRILRSYSGQNVKSSIAPGGVQYDTFVKIEELIPLKKQLEEIADSERESLKMSWYKKKNMGTRKIPDAHIEVVIWISTI